MVLLAAAAAAVVAIRPAAAAPPPAERREAALPRQIEQVVGLADGGALVRGTRATQLVRIAADGAASPERHPPAGALLALSASPAEVWALGSEAVLRRSSDGSWTRVPLPGLDPDGAGVTRTGAVVTLGPGRALLFRTHEVHLAGRGATVVHRVDAAGRVEAVELFPGLALQPAEPDDHGGAWTVVSRFVERKSNLPLGLGHLHDGRWLLWRPQGDLPVPPGFEPRTVERWASWASARLARDGRGGCFGAGYGDLTRLTERGVAVPPRPSVRDGRPPDVLDEAIAFDAEAGQVVALSLPRHPFNGDGGEPWRGSEGRLTRLDAQDRVASVVPVPLPAWMSQKWAPSLTPSSLHVAGPHRWASAGPLLLRERAGAWLALWPPQVERETIEQRRREARRAVLEPIVLVVAFVGAALLVLAAGAAVSRLVRRARFRQALGPSAAGALAGGVPAALLFGAAQHYQAAFAILALLVGTAAGTIFAGGTTSMCGEWRQPSRRPGLGLTLALLGAAIGSVLAIVTITLAAGGTRALPDPIGSLAAGAGAGVIGALAGLGHRLGSGGPRG